MNLRKYLDETYYNLLIDNYNSDYIETLDEDNFLKIYKLFQDYGFYFINDIVLKYLEIFTLESEYVEEELLKLKDKLGISYIYLIGNDMTYLNKIIDNYEDKNFV